MEQIRNIDERVVMFRTHNEVVRRRGTLVEATRKWWRCSERKARLADYVFSVIDGVVQEVYTINGCYKESDDGTAYPHFNGERNVFDFSLAPDNIREKYKEKRLPLEYIGGQNPVRYNF
ncbi:MAG: hypothetical protein SOT81_04680 [Treponema sp.]|nr:hypothetical protein [Treponema sp.]